MQYTGQKQAAYTLFLYVSADSGVEPAVESSEQAASSAQDATVPEEIPGGIADVSCSPEAAGSPLPPLDTMQSQVAKALSSEHESDGPSNRAASSPVEGTQGKTTSRTSSPEAPPRASSTPEPQPMSTAPPPATSAGLKRDMATSTEELNSLEAGSPEVDPPTPSPPHSPAPPPAPAPFPVPVPTTTKGGPGHTSEAKPKPKPSNEVTRDYIPKVGMTTYTIVPQKSLEKLRYFEVELTLEAPQVGTEPEVVATGLPDALDSVEKTHSESATTAQPVAAPPGSPGADAPLRNGAEPADSSTTAPPPQTSISASVPAKEVAARPEEPEHAFPTTEAAVAGEVKEKKVPPATKPKPASFRLPQHKRTPGYYVTSAAVKCAGGGSNREAAAAAGGLLRGPGPQDGDMAAVERVEEAVGEVEEEDYQFPPPPVEPAREEEEEEEARVPGIAPAEPDLKPADTSSGPGPGPSPSPSPSPSSAPPDISLTRQSSLPGKPPSPGLSLEKLRSFAAPKPYSPSSPSRFAQAVSSAVKRSQSHSQGPVKQTAHKVPLYPVTDRSPIKELTEPSKSMVGHFHSHMHVT